MYTVNEFKTYYDKYKEKLDIILSEMKALGTYVGIPTSSFESFYLGGYCEYFKGVYEIYAMDYNKDKLNIIYYVMRTDRIFDYNLHYASTYKIDLGTKTFENNRFRKNPKYEVIEQKKYEGVLPEILFDEKNIDGLTRRIIGKDFNDGNTHITQNVIYELEDVIRKNCNPTYDGFSYVFEPKKPLVESTYHYLNKNIDNLDEKLSSLDGYTIEDMVENRENPDLGVLITDRVYQEIKDEKRKELTRLLGRIKKD